MRGGKASPLGGSFCFLGRNRSNGEYAQRDAVGAQVRRIAAALGFTSLQVADQAPLGAAVRSTSQMGQLVFVTPHCPRWPSHARWQGAGAGGLKPRPELRDRRRCDVLADRTNPGVRRSVNQLADGPVPQVGTVIAERSEAAPAITNVPRVREDRCRGSSSTDHRQGGTWRVD